MPFITKFQFDDDESKPDQLHLTIANPGLRFKDDKRFQDGVRYRYRFGYLDDISEMKTAVIARAKPHYPTTGMPTIEMVAFTQQTSMNKMGNPINWGTVSSTEVARRIALRYGLKLEFEESNDARKQARIQAAGVTDIQFLMGLAKKLNWDCFIEENSLHFHHKKYDAPSELEFVYFSEGTGTLLSFDPEVKMTGPIGAAVAGTDPHKGETTAAGGSAVRERFDATTKAQLGKYAYPGKPLTDPSHETDPRLIDKHGEAAAQRVNMDAVKATAEMIGSPRVKARAMIRLTGIDQQYSGNWRVAKSKHVIEPKGVYKVTVNFKRDAAKAKTAEHNKHDDNGGNGGAKKREVDVNANNKTHGSGFRR